jgi:dCTP diphosphatase
MAGTRFESTLTVEDLRRAMDIFVSEREWQPFHTPRNVLLALVGEVGELAELFQWRGDGAAGSPLAWSDPERLHLGHELSDVLLYLVRLSDLCGVDLPSAAVAKMDGNRRKYPVDRARGRSDKYTAYSEEEAGGGTPAKQVAVGREEEEGAPPSPTKALSFEAAKGGPPLLAFLAARAEAVAGVAGELLILGVLGAAAALALGYGRRPR